jgi:putative PIG3 family NAD(P)H quinone oxidoreductase
MKAVLAPDPGGPSSLVLADVDDPVPGAGELLVRVHAAGINRADVLQRKGHYPPPPGAPDVLGLEAAGEVVAQGPSPEGGGAFRFAVGDRVCMILPGGGCGELVTVPDAVAMPWPTGLDAVGAGAVPEVFTTAYDNLFLRGRLAEGETVLLHGGSSGIGTAGIQLAKRAGCRVLVTASSDEKLAACAELGADAGIHYEREDVVGRVRELTDGKGVDVILDIVGGPYLDPNLRSLAVEGRLVIIGLMGGAKAELDLGRLLTRRLTVTASTLRARSAGEKAALARRMESDVWPGFADGSLRPVVDTVLPLARVAEAHERMESSAHIGKIVLTTDAID